MRARSSWIREAGRVVVVGALGAVAACARQGVVTSPQPGQTVVVEFYPARHVDVPVAEGSAIAYDGVVAVDGHVERVSGDTLWLRDAGVKIRDQWSWPNPRKALAVPGIGRTATVHRASSDVLTVGAIVVGTAFVIGVLAVAAFFFAPRSPGW